MGASTLKAYNSFVKGIITEAGPLTFPEDASLDEDNCVLNREGSRQRRLGMDFEPGYALIPTILTPTMAVSGHLWENVGNDTSLNCAVVQAGTRLMIFNAEGPTTSSSLLASFDGVGIPPGEILSYTAGTGYLFIACNGMDPRYIEYNSGTGTFSMNIIDVRVRDVFGVPDGLAVDTQPASLSNEHNYNLHNQGWATDKINAYHTTKSLYPSNAQQWFLGRKDDNTFDPNQLSEIEFGTTPAPKGKYTLNLFDRSGSRNSLSGIITPSDTDGSRPTTVAFAFQRVWYAGMYSSTPLPLATSPNLTGFVCYSRTVRGPQDFGRCYSEADPGSEIDSELVDTDGGFVIIPDSGKIHSLVPMGNGLVVIADNGVWAINGADRAFTATNQAVYKLSSFGAVGPNAVVEAEAQAFYWSRGGIYLIHQDQNGALVATNITEDTIQTLVGSLNLVAKKNATGAYDPVNKKVAWLYNDNEEYTGITFKNYYTKELIFDLSLEAWYKNSISRHDEPSPYVAGYIQMPDVLLRQEGVRSRGDSSLKYITVQFVDPDTNLASVTFSYYRDATFRDWKNVDGEGVSFLSYCVTGYELMGDAVRKKQAPYVFVHMKRTEEEAVTDEDGNVVANDPSGLYMQAHWGWANSPTSGRWTNPQQVYRWGRPYTLVAGEPIDYGDSVIVTRNRVRGSGKALSLYFYSDGDKDFYLHGWTVRYTGQQNV